MNNNINLKGKRILVIDDIEMYRKIVTYRLKLVGFNVEQAANGKIAYEMFLNHEPWYYDAIIMDIIMPVMNGNECAKLIRDSKRIDSLCVPIISISVDNSIENIKASMEVGIDDILDKPIDFTLLLEKLSRLINSNDLLKNQNLKKEENIKPSRYTKLWKLLIDKGITKTKLMEMIDCSSTTIAKLSKDEKVTNTTLKRIASALDCDISDIIEGE